MLIGQYEVSLTDKGRLAIPKKFRQILGDQVIIARWYEGCLVLSDKSKWQYLLERLTSKTSFITQSVRGTDRFILASAYEVDLDSQGRFVVPKLLLEYAKISESTVFVGLLDRVEVWDKKLWIEQERIVEKTANQLIEVIAEKERVVKEDKS